MRCRTDVATLSSESSDSPHSGPTRFADTPNFFCDLPDLIANDIRKVLSGLTAATEGIGASAGLTRGLRVSPFTPRASSRSS